MGNKPAINLNTLLNSLVLVGILGLFKAINSLQSDVAVLKSQQAQVIQNHAEEKQAATDFDRRIRALEFKRHGDGL